MSMATWMYAFISRRALLLEDAAGTGVESAWRRRAHSEAVPREPDATEV